MEEEKLVKEALDVILQQIWSKWFSEVQTNLSVSNNKKQA